MLLRYCIAGEGEKDAEDGAKQDIGCYSDVAAILDQQQTFITERRKGREAATEPSGQ